MRGSQKENLIVFLIIAVAAFCVSTAVASMTIHDDYDSYKLIALSNESFEPAEVDYVPTIIPKNYTNTTNATNSTSNDNITYDIEDTVDSNDTDYGWENIEEFIEDGL